MSPAKRLWITRKPATATQRSPSKAPTIRYPSGRCVAVAGFRVIHNLFSGDTLYVDDLSTLPDARGRGHGRALLEWCKEEGARQGCAEFHLDSGVGPEREDAHRLYFNTGLRITSYHFAAPLE